VNPSALPSGKKQRAAIRHGTGAIQNGSSSLCT